MKANMATLLQTVVLALTWTAAESAVLKGSTSTAAAAVHERETFEAKSHAQLTRWCNATLPAQGSRQSALQHLLNQAQSAENPASPEASDTLGLLQMEKQAADLGGEIERERLQTQAAQSLKVKEMASAALDLDDATRDVEALQHAFDRLGGAKKANPGVKAAAELLAKAKETKAKAQEKVTLLQLHDSKKTDNLSKLETQYRSKKADIVSFQHQFFTTQRSLDVLTSALEDESGYLSDLQSICGAETRVHDRLEKSLMPMLKAAPQLIDTSSGVAPVVAAPKAVAVKPAVVKVAAKPQPAAPKPVAVKPAVVKKAAAEPAAAKPVEAKKVAPKPAVKKAALVAHKKHKKVAPKPVAAPVVQKKVKAQKAKKVVAAKPAPVEAPKPAHKKAAPKAKKVAPAPVAPKPAAPVEPAAPVTSAIKDPFADDDDAAPAAAPVVEAPKPVAHKKKAAPVVPAKTAEPVVEATKSGNPRLAAAAAMKDPFADDDDDEAAAAPPPPPAPKHKKAAPALKKAPPPPAAAADDDSQEDAAPVPPPPAKKHKKAAAVKTEFLDTVYDSAAGNMPTAYSTWKPEGGDAAAAPKPQSAADAKKSMMAMLGTDSDDDDSAAPPPPPPRHVKKAAPKPVNTPAAESAVAVKAKAAADKGAKDAEAAFDADDDAAVAPAPKAAKAVAFDQDDDSAPPAKPAMTQMQAAKAAEAAFDGDDDSFDPKAAFESAKPAHKKVAALQEDVDSDEAIDKAFPEPTTPPKPVMSSALQTANKNKKRAAKKEEFQDSVYDAAAGNLPNQYAAWSPDEQNNAGAKSKAALAQMEADFDDDGDDGEKPTPAPKKHAKHHHQAPTPAPAPPPPPKPQASDDGVVYDDDDLPRHHNTNMRGLEGGWQAFMKKPTHQAVSAPKLDPDVAIMESLYTKDGSLPSQYTAWSPDEGAKPAAPVAQPAAALVQDSDDKDDAPMDLEAAAKAFAKNPEAAFDFLQVDSEDSDLADLIHSATGSMSFLQASTSTVDATRAAAASTVLEQYASVLNSKPLRQLAKAKLSPPKLEALFQQLAKVDPLVGKTPAVVQGKQAQAEQMCKYFQEHMQAAAPVQKAVALVETASNNLAESVSERAALMEEIDARTQLQRTMEQDMSSLTTLLNLAKQGEDTTTLNNMEKQLTGAAAIAFGASAAGVGGAHAELKDLLDLALQKRSDNNAAQKKKLAALQGQVKKMDADLAQKKTTAASSQAAMETARKKLAGITTSCDATLDALAKRRHAGHMEAHAIEVAIKVLGSA